jgi:hypothetical protein
MSMCIEKPCAEALSPEGVGGTLDAPPENRAQARRPGAASNLFAPRPATRARKS